jgi:hypothetical protein
MWNSFVCLLLTKEYRNGLERMGPGMGRFCSKGFALTAFLLAAVMQATNPVLAQNINDLLTIFGGDRQRATRQAAQAEWRRLPPVEMACIDRGLRRKGSSIEALVRRGVKPSAARLIELRSSCRQFAVGVQTDTGPALATDAIGSSTPNVPARNSTEPKDASVMPPSPAASVGQVAEVRVQQGNVEPKDSLPKSGMAWSSAAFLVAVSAIAMLLGMVIYLFTRWRNTEQKTVAVPTATDLVPDKDLEGGAGKVPSETTIGETREVVMPMSFTLIDKMIQLTDVTDQSATISMSKNCAYNNKIYSTCEEVLPRTILSEAPKLGAAESSDFSKMAQLAKLYAMGKPSEKEFQRLKGLISRSLRDSQAPKPDEFRDAPI